MAVIVQPRTRTVAVRSFLLATFALAPAAVGAQLFFPPPGPGTPVDFVTCPELTERGTWVGTDFVSGFTYSLVGAPPPPPNVVVRVSGIVSSELASVPGWLLTRIKIVAGQQPCRSVGVPQPSRGLFPLFPFVSFGGSAPPPPVVSRY